MTRFLSTNDPSIIGGTLSTTSGRFDPDYATHCTVIEDDSTIGVDISQADNIWVAFDYYLEGGATSSEDGWFFSLGTVEHGWWIRMNMDDGSQSIRRTRSTFDIQKDSTSYGALAEDHISIPTDQLLRVDINIVRDPSSNGDSASFAMYIDGSLFHSVTTNKIFDTGQNNSTYSGTDTIGNVFTIGGQDYLASGKSAYISNLRVSDVDMRGTKYREIILDDTGFYNQFTGKFGSSVELSESIVAFPTSAGQRQTSLLQADSLPDNGPITSVTVMSASRSDGLPIPDQLEHFVRFSGTDYDSGSPFATGSTMERNYSDWAVNPNTSSAWTLADLTTLEVGLLSSQST